MNPVDVREVLQWVLIVLAAGFIGQFGKTLAQYVMKRVRERSAGRSPEADQGVYRPPAQKPHPPGPAGGRIDVRGQENGPADIVGGFMNEKTGKKAAKARKKEVKLLKKMFK